MPFGSQCVLMGVLLATWIWNSGGSSNTDSTSSTDSTNSTNITDINLKFYTIHCIQCVGCSDPLKLPEAKGCLRVTYYDTLRFAARKVLKNAEDVDLLINETNDLEDLGPVPINCFKMIITTETGDTVVRGCAPDLYKYGCSATLQTCYTLTPVCNTTQPECNTTEVECRSMLPGCNNVVPGLTEYFCYENGCNDAPTVAISTALLFWFNLVIIMCSFYFICF